MTAPEPPAAPLPAPPAGRAPEPGSADAGGSAATDRSSVTAAVARLDGVHQLPLHEQPDVYQRVHADLQNALAAIEDA